MPGRYRDTHPWPLYALRITTPRLELRLPDDEDLVELFEAARAGIHPPGEMPFGIPVDGRDRGARRAGALPLLLLDHARSTHAPEVAAAVRRRRGRVVLGIQELCADDFAGSRSVSSGSWLTISAQGRGLGVEMRAAVLHLAFAGLGALEAQTSAWHDNPASQRVSLRLGYVHEGRAAARAPRRADRHLRYRLTREAWQRNRFDGIEFHGLEPCLAAPRRCMNLHRSV